MPSEQSTESYWARPVAPAAAPTSAAPGSSQPPPAATPSAAPPSAAPPGAVGGEQGPPTAGVRARLKVAAIGTLIALCAALPWVVPQVRDWFGSAVPESTKVVEVPDPTVAPPPPAKGGAVIPAAGLAGERLRAAGAPVQLVVKRLRVSSPVIPISGQSGALLPPSNPQELGWWQEGQVAGAKEGGVVITGHTVHTGGGAFDHLGELAPGDKVRVRTGQGWIGYVVVRSSTYSTAQLAKHAEEIFTRTGDGHLVLITCSDFNGRIYLSNSVVYAVPVSDRVLR